MAELEIRPPTPDDLPAIGALYRTVKGRERPESVTRHRFFGTPWGDSPAYIALDGDMCASVALAWPTALRIGDETVLAAQGTDAATHPDYRARPRLFLGLVRSCRKVLEDRGYGVYFTFPNTRSIKLLKVLAGTYLGEIGAWGIERTPRRRLLRRGWSSSPELGASPTRPPEVLGLIEAAQGDEKVIRVEKSETWLDWRYSEATAERYEWLLLEGGGSVIAAALVGERDPERWGADFTGLLRIHELFALGEDPAAMLLERVAERARSWTGVRKLDVLVKDPLLERAVERAGFVRESTRPITSFDFQENLPLDPYEFSHWRIISGDMDFF